MRSTLSDVTRSAAIDHIVIRQHQGADAGRSEIKRSWRTEPACADHHNACGFKLSLPRLADFGQFQVPRIALEEIGIPFGFHGRQSLGNPARGAASNRSHVRIALRQ
jgi:hypothetical protein